MHAKPFPQQIHYRAVFNVPLPASFRKNKTETGFLPEWSPDKAVGRRGPPLLCVQTDGGRAGLYRPCPAPGPELCFTVICLTPTVVTTLT